MTAIYFSMYSAYCMNRCIALMINNEVLRTLFSMSRIPCIHTLIIQLLSVVHLNLALYTQSILVVSIMVHYLLCQLIFLLKNLHNFLIIETVIISSPTVAISGMFMVLFITNSQFVTIVITKVMLISFEKEENKFKLSLLIFLQNRKCYISMHLLAEATTTAILPRLS